MPSHTGPNISGETDLVFGYDLRDTENSYKGRPSVNLVTDAANMSGWSSYSAGNNGTFITEFGTVGYKIRHKNTWNGLHKSLTLPSTGTYTVSAWLRLWNKTPGNNGINVYTNRGGINDTAQGGDDTKLGEWQRISMTRTYTDTPLTFFLISWGGTRGPDWSSWDVTMPQIEAGSKATPFVDGERDSTQSLVDITGRNVIDISNLGFDNDGQITFDGTDDFINTGINSSNWAAETFTIEGWVRYDNINGDDGWFELQRNGSNFGLTTVVRTNKFYFYWIGHGSNAGYNISSSAFISNSWIHITITHQGTESTTNTDVYANTKIYINGEHVPHASGGSAAASDGGELLVGSQQYSFAGDIPYFKYYNRRLTADEISANYRSTKSRFQ